MIKSEDFIFLALELKTGALVKAPVLDYLFWMQPRHICLNAPCPSIEQWFTNLQAKNALVCPLLWLVPCLSWITDCNKGRVYLWLFLKTAYFVRLKAQTHCATRVFFPSFKYQISPDFHYCHFMHIVVIHKVSVIGL